MPDMSSDVFSLPTLGRAGSPPKGGLPATAEPMRLPSYDYRHEFRGRKGGGAPPSAGQILQDHVGLASVTSIPRSRSGHLASAWAGRFNGGALMLGLLGGCDGAPSRNILGSYFPSWMVCALAGIALALIARAIFKASGLLDGNTRPVRRHVGDCICKHFRAMAHMAVLKNDHE